MNFSLIKGDLKRNKAINLTLFLFMLFAASLVILSSLMAIQIFSSISEMYKIAQPPHFVQMHKGELDYKRIESFMNSHEAVEYNQIVTMLNVYGSQLTILGKSGEQTLSNCLLDIGLVKQNSTHDLLLNSNHERIVVRKGEVGLPILLKQMYGINLGDKLILTEGELCREFVITNFVLDSAMNSSLASSTRVLLSDQDFAELEPKIGEQEYLIEAYFADPKSSVPFQTAYEHSGLPQNGQAVTYSMIFLLSALTDVITVFILILVSVLLVAVSFICLKYTIMAALEEDVREIGTMKAIGISYIDICKIYLVKYRVLAGAAVFVGYIFTLLCSGFATKRMTMTFGGQGVSALALIISVAGGLLVFLVLDYYCKKVLKTIKEVSVIDTLVLARGFGKERDLFRDGLSQRQILPVNFLLAWQEVIYNFKSRSTVFIVVAVMVLMIMIPVNLVNTFKTPDFITYMGSTVEDIMIEIEYGSNIETHYATVKQILKSDQELKDFNEYKRVRVQTLNLDNALMHLHIDSGEGAGEKLRYLQGNAPKEDFELALSYLNAKELGKQAQDDIVLMANGENLQFTVTGIYQDVTSGGFTAKAIHNFDDLESKKYTFTVALAEQSKINSKVKSWQAQLSSGIIINSMENFLKQTLGGITRQLQTVVSVLAVIGIALAVLIAVLFLKLRLAKEIAELAILRALGFSKSDLTKQFLLKMGFVAFLGICTGIILTNLLGNRVINLVLTISGLGVKQIALVADLKMQYILPLSIFAALLLASWAILRTFRVDDLITIIRG